MWNANKCEVLDELEEWKMLMQHSCVDVGSTVKSVLHEVWASSPKGFLAAKSAVYRKESRTKNVIESIHCIFLS